MTPRVLLLALTVGLAALGSATAAPAPSGRAVMAWHVTIAPSWLDPSTAPPQITPFGLLYAIHDALVRPYPGHKMGPSLAESWTESADGKTYEFRLRAGLKFHNGDPVTADDVKFSFERYKGAGASILPELRAASGGGESADGALPSEGGVAGLHDVLRHHRHRGRPRRAAQVRHPGRRRRFPQASYRRRPLQVRQPPARRGGRAGGVFRLLAQGAEREDAGDAQRARGDDARRDAEERRGGHLLRAGWRRRRRHPA